MSVSQPELPGLEESEPKKSASFDVCGELPDGVTLLEASAGTGKTFTIAALVARYVAEGTKIEQLLVVTFTRMATGELRDRVRHQLVAAADGLERAVAGENAGEKKTDALVELLARGPERKVHERLANLRRAIADFDAATIDTTHGFCLHVLMGLGVTGDVERDVSLVEDVSDLLEEVVDDLYVRKFRQRPPNPKLTRRVAYDVAVAVEGNVSAHLLPDLSDGATNSALRRRLAEKVRQEMTRRKRSLGILTYDDLLTRLRDALDDPERGPAACRRLSTRYEVVLVDEFQDTDPVQWEILEKAFGSSTLVLIGDPKQAIYAFRGADVFAYMQAASSAKTRATLDTNWRSDKALVCAYDVLFADAQLGHAGIPYHPVKASEDHQESRLVPSTGALRFRFAARSLFPDLTQGGLVSMPLARRFVAADLAGDVRDLVESGARIDRGADRSAEAPAVGPGDVAVLVRTNSEANIVRDALNEVGVPAVVAGGQSVFETPAATDWLRLLLALDRPTSRSWAATASLTTLIGWDASRVAGATQEEWEELHFRLAAWSNVLRLRGVAALAEQITLAGLPARALELASGERVLTDLLHIGRLLHAAAVESDLGLSALVTWLKRRIDEAERDRNNEDRSLRLESDAKSVQVLTIHRSKGLEFPIVYCPFLWDPVDGSAKKTEIPVFHDPDHEDRLTVDVGGDTIGFSEHKNYSNIEKKGEDLRLLYVALTRARHQAVVWWVAGSNTGRSPLFRILSTEQTNAGLMSVTGGKVPSDDEMRKRLAHLSEVAPAGSIAVEEVGVPRAGRWSRPPEPATHLEASVFDRVFDQEWRRTSYSGITARSHEATVASEPDEHVTDDEPDSPDAETSAPALGRVPEVAGGPADLPGDEAGAAELVRLSAVALPLSGMPGGVEVGSFVHSVLETTDFAAQSIETELEDAIARITAHHPVDVGDPDLLVKGLANAIRAPLGPLVDGVALRSVERSDRLDEVSFELPLAGGDTPTGSFSVADIATVMRRHLAGDDVLHEYADRLSDPALRIDLRGFLTGSLDLVFRMPGNKMVVVDYKTNRLAARGEDVSAWHYRQPALQAEMLRVHYPLQALLYTVAVHRYMRSRDPAYDPAVNLAAVLYLFVRGMSSTEMPEFAGSPCGVWSWRPPAGLVCELSDLFDTGAR